MSGSCFIMILFVFRVCLCFFVPSVSSCCSKIKSRSTMILCVIPNVSLLVHSCLPGCLIFLFQIEMPLQKNRNRVEWKNVACDSYSCCSQSQLRWIKNFQHQASGTSNTSNMHTHRLQWIWNYCLGPTGVQSFWIWSRVWDALPETHFHSILQKTIFEKTFLISKNAGFCM